MEIRTSKRTLTVLVVFFFVFLAGTLYFFLFHDFLGLFAPSISLQEELMDYCDLVEEDEFFTLMCNSFIKREYINDDDERCLLFIVASEDGRLREDVEICIHPDKMDWENPYADYSLYVPASLRIDYEFGEDEMVKAIRGNPIDDDNVHRIKESIGFFPGQPIPVWTNLHVEATERGYDTVMEKSDEFGRMPIGISIREAEVLSYDTLGDLVSIEIEAFFSGDNSVISFNNMESFFLWDNLREEGDEKVLINSSNIEEIDLDSAYRVILVLEDPSLFSDEFVKDQLALLADGEPSAFLLDRISIIYED